MTRPSRQILVSVFGILVLTATGASATTYYVSCAAPNNTLPGTAWNTPKQTIGGALAIAVPGDQIRVREGIYKEKITVKAGIKLYGGYLGCGNNANNRDPKVFATILDGQKTVGSVVTLQGGAGVSIFDGFTVQNGLAQYGGGILTLSNVKATIDQCVFRDNRAAGSYSLLVNAGGAIYLGSNNQVTISHSTFLRNESQISTSFGSASGGALSMSRGVNRVDNCLFSDNRTIGPALTGSSSGGSIYVNYGNSSGSNHKILNCTFAYSSAQFGGAIRIDGLGATTDLEMNVFSACVSTKTGGVSGIYVSPNTSSPLVVNANRNCEDSLSNPYNFVLGTGNISAIPGFANAAGRDFHLGPNSPCFDIFNTGAQVDFEGDIRPQPGVLADMGCDEDPFGKVMHCGIQGTMSFPDGNAELRGTKLSIDLCQSGVPIYSGVLCLDAWGNFYLPLPAAMQGVYAVRIGGAPFLANVSSNVALVAGQITKLTGNALVMFGGDLNGDCTVDQQDLATAHLWTYQHVTRCFSGWCDKLIHGVTPKGADSNRDGVVDQRDVQIVFANQNKVCPPCL